MNLVILKGRLGQDPDVRYTQSGVQVARLSVATSKRWTDKASGEKAEKTEWHRVVFWERLADVASQYLGKGSEVLITGEIQTRQYTNKEGATAYATEIIGRELELIGGRAAGTRSGEAETPIPSPHRAPAPRAAAAPPASTEPDFDDDIPF